MTLDTRIVMLLYISKNFSHFFTAAITVVARYRVWERRLSLLTSHERERESERERERERERENGEISGGAMIGNDHSSSFTLSLPPTMLTHYSRSQTKFLLESHHFFLPLFGLFLVFYSFFLQTCVGTRNMRLREQESSTSSFKQCQYNSLHASLPFLLW